MLPNPHDHEFHRVWAAKGIEAALVYLNGSGASSEPHVDLLRCPQHGNDLELGEARIEWGMISPKALDRLKIEKARFPFSNRVVLGGCLLQQHETVPVIFCDACRSAAEQHPPRSRKPKSDPDRRQRKRRSPS